MNSDPFAEKNPVDEINAKLDLAAAILSVLYEQHSVLSREPEINQNEIATLLYGAERLVTSAKGAACRAHDARWGQRNSL